MKQQVQFPKLLTKAVLFFFLLSGPFLLAQPVITSVYPTLVTTNSKITIEGTGFGGTNNSAVTIGGVNSSTTTFEYVLRSDTKIILNVKGAVSGTVRMRTITPTQYSNYSSESISYIAPVVKNTASGNRIDHIYTDYNGYWSSGVAPLKSSVKPDNRHNLLGFKFNGVVYSTGVNDQILTDNGVVFNNQEYRAYSSRGVEGKVGSATYLAMGDLIDGSTGVNGASTEIQGLGVFDVLIDGVNGLDIGTGVTNFNSDASISFFSDNAQNPSGHDFADNVPEVLVTQIAQPGNTDYYHFSDVNGNIVGNPIRMDMSGISLLGTYRLDLFNFPANSNLATAVTNGNTSFGTNEERDIRMVGLRFSDFGIDASNFAQIHSFDMLAGGTADVAFLAYNTSSFHIASPVITSAPNSVRLCNLPYANNVTFSVGANIQGGMTGTMEYQWKKNNTDILPTDTNYSGANTSTLTVHGPIDNSKLATYKVEIKNEYGAIVASSAVLRQGGTPAIWNGTSWSTTPTSSSSLTFTSNYDSATDLASGVKLEGCDCNVENNVSVVIDSGDTMILQNSLNVAAVLPGHFEPAYDSEGNPLPDVWVPTKPAGRFILRDDASLVQISETATNSGLIEAKRAVTNLHPYDYVYWSSPVSGFNVTGLSSYSTPMYTWNPTSANTNGTYGGWANASGTMSAAKGYIARVSNGNNFEITFGGAPHNGVYTVALSGATNAAPGTNYWNLVGNPYPSPINAKDFLTTNADIQGNVRIWTHGTPIGNNNTGDSPFYQNFQHNYGNQYITYNGLTSVPAGFNGNIASGQGFFVQGKSTTGTVRFQNTFRYNETQAPYGNSQFYRQAPPSTETEAAQEKSIIWLSLVNSANTSASTAIGYVDDATLDMDRMYDASYEAENFSIYSLVNESEQVIIQGRPLPFDNDAVPVGFSVPSTGVYRIGLDKVEGLFSDASQDIFLEDTYLNVVHNLRTSPYSFTATTAGNATDRFTLRYQNWTLSTGDNNLSETFAFIKGNMLEIQSSANIRNVDVFDLSGKKVASFKGNSQMRMSADFNYASGFYLANITLQDGSVVSRKVAN